MTIGLYDIDFNHGQTFSLSLPLMKAWTRFIEENHQVIMMRPYEKTGRFNRIFYFKENPNLRIPNNLIVNTTKGTMVGYGFYGAANLSEKTRAAAPSFQPYELYPDKIKNKNLFRLVKNNSLVDWREQDFSYYFKNKTSTYVNDRDFLKEPNWEEIFNAFDNTIQFIHPIKPKDFEESKKILRHHYGNLTQINIPVTLNIDQIKYYLQMQGVVFDPAKVSDEKLFLFILIVKCMGENYIQFTNRFSNQPFRQNLLSWGSNKEQISYANFLGVNFNELASYHFNFKYRILLKQNPKTITLKDIEDEYLTF